jgi:hypothetical protein
MNKIVPFLFLLVFSSSYSQFKKPFVGTLVYEVTNLDRPEDTPLEMIVFSLDSLVRIETPSPVFGAQIFIKHIPRKKSYLLISLSETDHYAIKDDFKNSDSSKIQVKYIWKRKWGKKTIGGLNAKKVKLTLLKSNQSFDCYYSKEFAAKYQDAYQDFPGIPLEYYVETEDGIIKYILKKHNKIAPNYDLFGIPSNYNRVTFDEFVDLLNKQ